MAIASCASDNGRNDSGGPHFWNIRKYGASVRVCADVVTGIPSPAMGKIEISTNPWIGDR
ncbi:MAG: hypothetical protein ACLTKE_01250 [Coprococcus sp.]